MEKNFVVLNLIKSVLRATYYGVLPTSF